MTIESELLGRIKKAVLEYRVEECEDLARQALKENIETLYIADSLNEGIKEIGDAFGRGDIFLPELVMAAEAVKKGQAVIEVALKKKNQAVKSLGRFMIGTVAEDIHDIGKNIVGALFEASGFEVIDLGVEVPAAKFIQEVRKHKPHILGLSALLTSTAPRQREVIEALKKEDLRDQLKVIVGGSPITRDFAESIGADGYGANAAEGVNVAKRLLSHILPPITPGTVPPNLS
jgi:corrinoid protein of di/trimethylamine methyltransferase